MTSARASIPVRIAHRIADMTIVNLMPAKAANLLQCSQDAMWNSYFQEAERLMEEQWNETIWPLIKDFDFTTVLELSPGSGRNTEMLSKLASRLFAVDYNQYALDQTLARLGTRQGGCEISYHRNNGLDLAMVPDETITAIYCWDSAVHFEKSVLLGYIGEFARILVPGGSGFLHHSDLGDRASKNIKRNPHWRSNVSKELVADACRENGLAVTRQQPVLWPSEPGMPAKAQPVVDCATVFRKL